MNRKQTLSELTPMTADQILDVMEWMNKQAMAAHREISDSALIADQMRNAYYEGMRNGFLEAIKGLMSTQDFDQEHTTH